MKAQAIKALASIELVFEALPKREPQHRQSWRSNVVDHGLKDAKGRAIGGLVEAYEWTDGFRVYVRATRDGEVFGAIPRSFDCKTLEDAARLSVSKLLEQRTRYAHAAANEHPQFRKKVAKTEQGTRRYGFFGTVYHRAHKGDGLERLETRITVEAPSRAVAEAVLAHYGMNLESEKRCDCGAEFVPGPHNPERCTPCMDERGSL